LFNYCPIYYILNLKKEQIEKKYSSKKYSNFNTCEKSEKENISKDNSLDKEVNKDNTLEITPKIQEDKYYNYDKFLDKQGFTLSKFKVIFLTCLILTVEGLHMTLFSLMIIPLTKFLQMSENQTKFISSILFAGLSLGSISLGTMS